MAFNFSKIKLPRPAQQSGQAIPPKAFSASSRVEAAEAALQDSPTFATRAG